MKKMTFKVVMLMLISAFFVSCTQPVELIPGYEGTRLNPDFLSDVDNIKALKQGMLTGDLNVMEMYLHEDFFTTGPAIDDHTTRQEEIDSWLYFAEHFDNAATSSVIYYSFICDAYEGRPELIGKWVFEWGNISYSSKASGLTAEHPYHIAYRIRDDKVDYLAYHYDKLSRNLQLGFTMIQPVADEQ
jgi:hypothetical protein